MTAKTRETLLAQNAQIQRMEAGKLCLLRQGPRGAYYNLECRENGQPLSRYIPREQVETAPRRKAVGRGDGRGEWQKLKAT